MNTVSLPQLLLVFFIGMMAISSAFIIGMAVLSHYRNAKKTKILVKVKESEKTWYSLSIYRVERGAFVETLLHFNVDSIFKVAQYAPPNFDHWLSSWIAKTRDRRVHTFERYYDAGYSGDGNLYVIVVSTYYGEAWSEKAITYLKHL